MNNYNERLDEILEILHNSWLEDDYDTKDPDAIEAKQALTSLIKELVAEAKPEHELIITVVDKVRNNTIDEFEQKLLKT